MAVANYRDTNGHYPPAYVNGPDGKPWHSWRVLILPFIEQEPLFKQYKFDEPWDGPNNRKLIDQMPKSFAFPDRDKVTRQHTSYFAVVGPETVWPGDKGCPNGDVADGESQTIMIVENAHQEVNWMEPRDLKFDAFDFAINRPNGLSSPYREPAFVTCGDDVYRVSRSIKPDVLRALLTRNGREPISSENGWHWIADGRTRPR